MWSALRVSLKKKHLLLWDGVFFKCQLDPADWWCCWVQPCPDSFSACLICQCLTDRMEAASCTSGCWALAALWVLAACILTLFCSVCTCLGLLCLLRGLTPFYYVMPTFTPDHFPCFEINFVWSQYGSSSLLWLVLACDIFLHSFTFHLSESLIGFYVTSYSWILFFF